MKFPRSAQLFFTVAELRGVKLDPFSDFGLFSNTPHGIGIGAPRRCRDAWF